MKRKFLAFLFCLYAFMSIGQVFPQGDAEWVTVYRDYPCATSLGYHTWIEKLTRDTVINGYTYQVLNYEPLCIIHYQSKTCPAYEAHSPLSPTDIGAIRQEGSKVFFYKYSVPDYIFKDYDFIIGNLTNNTETLLYDFSWSTGDTVRIYTEQGLHRTYLVTNDEIIDGKKNITLKTLFDFGVDIKVIEGIGETRGIFGMYYFFNPNHDNLLESCFFQDGELIEDHSQCHLCGHVGTYEPAVQTQLHLYPNPTTDKVYIDTRDLSNPLVLQVYNLTGVLLYSDYEFQWNEAISFQHQGLKGWMLITLTTGNGFKRTGKVWVN